MSLDGVNSSSQVTSLHSEETVSVNTEEQKINSAFGDEVKEKTKIDGEISYDFKDPECPESPELPKEKSGFRKFLDGFLRDMIYSVPLYGDYMKVKDTVNTMKGVGTKVEKITQEDGTKVETHTITDKNGNITRISQVTHTDGGVEFIQSVYDKSGNQLSTKTISKYPDGHTSTEENYTDDNGNCVTEYAGFSQDGTMTYLSTIVRDKDGNEKSIYKRLNDDGTMSVEETLSDTKGIIISSVEKTIGKDGQVIDN